MKKYIPLGVYYAIILLIARGVNFTLSLIFIILAILLIFLYRITRDETVFYSYLLLSIIALIFPFWGMNPYSIITTGTAYSLLSLPLYHFIDIRFREKYKKIYSKTLTYTFLSLPASFFSVYFFIFIAPSLNLFFLSILIISLTALIIYISSFKS